MAVTKWQLRETTYSTSQEKLGMTSLQTKKIRELFSETKRQEGEKTEKKDKWVYLLSSNKKKKRNSE